MNSNGNRSSAVWMVKAMETKGPTLYCSFSKRPGMTIYDSKVYTDIHEAIARCEKLNPEPIAIGIVQGAFPVSTWK